MTTQLEVQRTGSVDGGSGRAGGIGMVLAASASNQTGAALGALAFPSIGAVGVVAVRQLVTAVVLAIVARPRLTVLRREQWMPVIGLAISFSIMNLCLYAAVDRIGLGLAVTLEFLGPLAVAIAGSRRRIDLACALLAAVGVVVLTRPGPTTDVWGIGLALTAAAAWGAYILLNRAVGRRLPGIQGTAVASLLTGVALWVQLSRWNRGRGLPPPSPMPTIPPRAPKAMSLTPRIDAYLRRETPMGWFLSLLQCIISLGLILAPGEKYG